MTVPLIQNSECESGLNVADVSPSEIEMRSTSIDLTVKKRKT